MLQNDKRKQIFEDLPVNKAVLALAIPSIFSQLINVVYNMADTFFIGKLNDPNQVAAATIALPLFMLLTAIANIFGIGGGSLISRSLGLNKKEIASKAASFSIWTSIIISALYGLGIYLSTNVILPKLGANELNFDYTSSYLFWTIVVGAIPTMLSALFANLIRAEGDSKAASNGIILGGILNIILDPIFIFKFNMQIKGAAIATLIANTAAFIYFIIYIFRHKEKTVIKLNPRYFTLEKPIVSEVVSVGMPSFMMTSTATFSNIILNNIMSSYSNYTVAAMGIAKKIDLVNVSVSHGFTIGTMPLIGYNYASKNHKRMMKSIKYTAMYSIGISIVGGILLFVFSKDIMQFFINHEETVRYGEYFQKVFAMDTPFIAANFLIVALMQSIGEKKRPLFLSIFRKTFAHVILMYIANYYFGSSGVVWSMLVADFSVMLIAIYLISPYLKKFNE